MDTIIESLVNKRVTHEEWAHQLSLLKIAESGANGGLKGTVAGLLIRAEVGLTLDQEDFGRLRASLDRAEAAHRAVVDYLCEVTVSV